jgi:hyperosmotically inducible protein
MTAIGAGYAAGAHRRMTWRGALTHSGGKSVANKEHVVSDHPMEAAVMQALAENPVIHADEIAVQAIDGNVVLRGTVGSLVQHAEAVRTARNVPGVRTVDDQLRVRPLGIDERADADTEAAVLAALIADDELHAADIDVEAREGTVILRGLVELPSQRDKAERIALEVGGVEHVSMCAISWGSG